METFSAGVPIVLDSSVWIAYLHKEDSQHTKACAVVGELVEPIAVPAEVLDEVATTLKNKKQTDLAKGFVQQVISDGSSLRISDEHTIRSAAEAFLARTDKLSFTDTLLLILAKSYRVITFDRDLQKAIEQAGM